MGPLQQRDRARGWTEEGDATVFRSGERVELGPERLCGFLRGLRIRSLRDDSHEVARWGIAVRRPHRKFDVRKAGRILFRGEFHRVVRGLEGLDQDFARLFAAPGASSDLRDLLISAFGGAQIALVLVCLVDLAGWDIPLRWRIEGLLAVALLTALSGVDYVIRYGVRAWRHPRTPAE